MKPILLLSILFFWTTSLYSQKPVTLDEKRVLMPTYPVAQPENSPVFFRGEAYQGASRYYYPLAMNDQYVHERVEQHWKHLVLENEYIELAIAPEIGGKLYYATDKTNGYHFIYKNNVVKPSNIGMTGAWVSGGIEWCVLHHHRASTFLPVDYTTTENADGSKTIWVGEYEPRHGMHWSIGITVYPGKSYFKAEGRIYNGTPFTHTFLYWANVAAHANENYQTLFPPSANVVTFHSKNDFSRWPISTERYRGADFTEGVDISWWKNVEGSNSFFVHDLKEDFMGGYDHGNNSGTVHVGDHNIVKGAKLWEWGSGERGQATEGRLTENDGPYVEIMVGAFSDNQPDYSWIRPYEVKKWEQYWYPVKGIGGFKNANLQGAVNLEEKDKNRVFLGFYSTGKIEQAKVVLKQKGEAVFTQEIEISPEKPYADTIQLKEPYTLTDLHAELVNVRTNETLLSYTPLKTNDVDELPETWQGYRQPAEIETTEELYLTGKRVEQFYAPRYDAMDWYNEALKRDPGDIRTNTAVGNHYLKRGDYQSAHRYLLRAVNRLTGDYTRPSDCEALYLHGLALRGMGRIDAAVDTLYCATWDYACHAAAYFQLAQLSAGKGDLMKAIQQVNESLSTNTRNNNAIALKSALQRRLGDLEGAQQTLQSILKSDPLDFRIANEKYLLAREAGRTKEADEQLRNLLKEMRDDEDNYLTIASGYIQDGLFTEAEEVLLRLPEDKALTGYYLGYIYSRIGNSEKALEYFREASEHAVESVFPYRTETVAVLEEAQTYLPDDGKANYYIGNILYDKQPEKAIEAWHRAVSLSPDLAMAYRNLGWGYYHNYQNIPEAISYYEQAMAINKGEALWYTELDELYELSNTPVRKRLELFDGMNEIVRKRDDAFIRQIEVLTLAGYPDKAVEYLEGMQFAYREGTSRVREIIIDAHLMLGRKYFASKDYDKALAHFMEARVRGEEAGSARLGNRDLQVEYYIGKAYEALGESDEADRAFAQVAAFDTDRVSVMDYYWGLALLKTGEADKARKVFSSLVDEAEQQLQTVTASEAGVIFGALEAGNVRQSRYLTMKGLGRMGLGEEILAKENLKAAAGLSYSNLWAQEALNDAIRIDGL